MENLLMLANCLLRRKQGYEKAIAMSNGEIPWENGYNWPSYPGPAPGAPENVTYWRGCVAELSNTLDMLNHTTK